MSNVIIRPVSLDDADALFALRLESLQTNPEAFGADYKTTLAEQTAETYAERIPPDDSDNAILCAEVDGNLVGMMGFVRQESAKIKHYGFIWGVYIQPAMRGKGFSKKLLQAMMNHIHSCEGLVTVGLMVITENIPAIKLYQTFGFTIWGTQPKALKVDGKLYDMYSMIYVIEGTPNAR